MTISRAPVAVFGLNALLGAGVAIERAGFRGGLSGGTCSCHADISCGVTWAECRFLIRTGGDWLRRYGSVVAGRSRLMTDWDLDLVNVAAWPGEADRDGRDSERLDGCSDICDIGGYEYVEGCMGEMSSRRGEKRGPISPKKNLRTSRNSSVSDLDHESLRAN